MKKDIVILGSKGCAKEALFLLEENNKIQDEWNILGFIDTEEGEVCGYPILGDDDWLIAQKRELHAVCAVGCPKVKEKIQKKYQSCTNILFPNIISRHALVGDRVTLGEGCIICAGAIVTIDVQLGNFVTLDKNCVVSHESVLGDFTTLSPGVHVSGDVRVGRGVKLGTGSQVIQGLNIGDHSVIGAGATVIRDIPENATAVGCPAKVIRTGE